ncbi:hypothetical protein LTR91_017146 [Friedmanniomyces endolithicus]|uniref:DNA (cytosine-5-)-methyltransferase n=1 Tax=Friedmanniomyces endolithicus TaxID=329885 RepID=A0AAN6K6R4_9PEZI|nr:hypothetical protein LTR91_017146 [Friedmanniomyces endolithicus]KAK1005995.1 hypothetical protein LTS01_003071 [Friedmanniomyces endolithicus]
MTRHWITAYCAADENTCKYKGVAGKKGHCGAVLKLLHQETDPSKGIADAAPVLWWRTLEATGKGPSTIPSGISVDLTSETDEKAGTTGRDRSASRHQESRSKAQAVPEDEQTVLVNAPAYKVVRQRKRSRTEVSGETEFLLPLTPRKVRNSLVGNFIASSTVVKFEALLAEPRTHFDFLAGGDGATTGAEEVGSSIAFLLEKPLNTCNNLRLAFPLAHILHKFLGDFLSNDRSYEVATAHISYPCKTYSPAHTAEVGTCKYDYETEDTSSVNDIVRKTRAKIVTFEQTDGMVKYTKNKHVWRRLLQDITLPQYSVRWRVMDATEHGNPSKRNRLIILTACSGHPLPDFPPPRPGPKNTIRRTLDKVGPVRDIEDHMLRHSIKDDPSYDDNFTLPYTIVCKSSEGGLHPSGKRSFNMQELAMLAGFPRRRKFAPVCMTALREIIGNAVPDGLAKDLYKMVHKGLDEGEAEMGRWLVEVGALTNEDVERVMRSKKPETIDLSMKSEVELMQKRKKRLAPATRFDDEDVIMIDD